MKRSEFDALPVTVQLRCILEAFPGIEQKLAALEAPPRPSRPRYDERIRRKGGFQWASETDIEALRYYHSRAAGGTDPAFTERNMREAIQLARWLQWREYYPGEAWEGERNRAKTTALPPSAKPPIHHWEVRNATPGTTTATTLSTQTSNVNFRALDGEDEPEEEESASGF